MKYSWPRSGGLIGGLRSADIASLMVDRPGAQSSPGKRKLIHSAESIGAIKLDPTLSASEPFWPQSV